MFSAMLEVNPVPEQFDAYLGMAKILRPELEQIEGFIDNNRYASLTREGWLLSLSSWRDEKALIRWRTPIIGCVLARPLRIRTCRKARRSPNSGST
jgi:heme-degrading monooxygenase HmoA